VKTLLYITLAAFIFMLACEPTAELDKETTAKIYVDKLFLTEKYSNQGDTLQTKLDSMFQSYNVQESVFDSSIKFYMQNDKDLDKFFNIADDYVDTLKVKSKN
jgi:thiamine biosynthesis lipoprotein ApbE